MRKKIAIFSCIAALVIGVSLFFIPGSPKEYCAFCDPKVIANQLLFEDKNARALLTYKPIAPGHTLVIPKRHVERFEDLSDAEVLAIAHLIQKVNKVISKTYGTTGYLLLEKNGKEAWQTVPHVHFHYVPRKENDSSSLIFLLKSFIASFKKPLSPEEISEEREKIEKNV